MHKDTTLENQTNTYNRIVLDIARDAIEKEFTNDEIDIGKYTKDNPWLKKDGASFVTLTLKEKLRGCIGSLLARRPLVEDIIENAKNAAFRDPRFPKLTKEEFDKIAIEVSILSEPKELFYSDVKELKRKIKPFEDGVILSLGDKQATFLPQVWEELAEFETFFGHLLHKAGLPMDSFKYHPKIFTYKVEKFS